MAWQTLPWFKAFPTFRRHWVRLLVRQEYANCPLTSTRAGLDSGTFLAAPRCQCVWRAPGPGEPGLSQWKFKKGQRRRTCKIPLWAAKGAPESFAPTMLEQSPRCLLVTPQMQRGPLQGKVGRRLAKTCCATILATLPPVGRQVGGKSNRVEET